MPAAPADPSPAAPLEHRRIVAAGAAAVYAAFADPRRLARWWGPAGFTNEFAVFDFQPGGAWRFTMRGPDGAAYAMDHVFLELVPGERVVIRHRQPGHDFTLTVTLSAHGAGTEVRWTQRFDEPAGMAHLRAFVTAANEQNLDRLEAELGRPVSG